MLMRPLSRPDTVYLFGFARWVPEIAEKINAARAQALGPRAMSLVARVERVLAEVDAFEAERLRRLPWDKMLEEVREYEKTQDGALGGEEVEAEIVHIELGGHDFAVGAWSPKRGCTVQLQSAFGTVHLRVTSPKPNAPNVYIEIGSAALWQAHDWKAFLRTWQSWLDSLTQIADPLHVTRIDAAFHCQGLTSEDLDRSKFTCRAETVRVYTKEKILERLERAFQADEHCRQTGFEPVHVAKLIEELHKETGMVSCDWYKDTVPQMIGLGRRNQIYCRIYNKTREVMRSPVKRAMFEEIWKKANYDALVDVYNIEFEMGRAWLNKKEFRTEGRTFRIDSLEDLIVHYDSLMTYLIGNDNQQGWLRMHNQDATRAERCTTHDVWKTLREAAQVLPEIAAWERTRVQTRMTASRILPGAVRLKARLDALRGVVIDEGSFSVQTFMESMAEVMSAEVNRSRRSKWSEYSLEKAYLAERSRVLNYKPTEAFAS